MLLAGFLWALIALAAVLPALSLMPTSVASQTLPPIEYGSKQKFTLEWENILEETDYHPYARTFHRVTGEIESVADYPETLPDGDLVFRGIGTGKFEYERGPDYYCEGGSVSGTYNSWIRGHISLVPEDLRKGKDVEITGAFEALPAPPGLVDASLIDTFEELDNLLGAETTKAYEKITPVKCRDRFDETREYEGGVIGRPQYLSFGFLNYVPKPDGTIEYEETTKIEETSTVPAQTDRLKITIGPSDLEYRVHGTVKDNSGKPILESKVVMKRLDELGDSLPVQKLSDSKPAFEDETTSDSVSGKYELRYVRPNGSLDEKLLVASLLWYDANAEFAVTNGKEAGGRYIPVYLVQCVDHQDIKCAKWKEGSGGFEVELDFVYGIGAEKAASVMKQESWEVGSAASLDQVMAEAAIVYSNSYKAMKYFEGIKGSVGVALEPIMIKVRDQTPNCNFAQYDAQAKLDKKYPSFGDLGKGLDIVESTGSSIRICDKRSSIAWDDIPVNREWHELSHYLNFEMYLNYDNRPFENHAGYANESTNDSLAEGFAEFVAMLIAEHYGAAKPYLYPTRGAVINLEEDYKVWGESVFAEEQPENGTLKMITFPVASYHEEWALAGILWDLHDSGSEVNPRHVIGQDGKGQNIWASTSKVYPDSRDSVSLSGEQILQVINNNEPKTLYALYQAFKSSTSAEQLDMIFVNHGAFGDVVDRNLVQDLTGEEAGPTGHATERLIRGSAAPALPGSYLSSSASATIRVMLTHDEPFNYYDYSYNVDIASGEPTYFEMPPSYYPSKALIEQVSADGRTISNVTVIDSHDYWKYIQSNPASDGIFGALQVTGNLPPANTGASDGVPETSSTPQSGCLIATAAFGSDLAPQVQFLRNFRDNHILATASGSSFMTAFNAWYYSFSPQLADYERQQPWFQQTVRIAIYPLLGILEVSEKAYSIIPGEYGSVAAGLVASSLIGAVYMSPIAVSIKQVRKIRLDYRIALLIVGAISLSVIASVSLGSLPALTLTTAILVLSTMALTALVLANFYQNLVKRMMR